MGQAAEVEAILTSPLCWICASVLALERLRYDKVMELRQELRSAKNEHVEQEHQ